MLGHSAHPLDGPGPSRPIPQLALITSIVYHTTLGGGVLSILTGQWGLAAFLLKVTLELEQTDRWWKRITSGNDRTDGVVEGVSQVYPNAIRNVTARDPASHAGEIDTQRSYNEIHAVLRDDLEVVER